MNFFYNPVCEQQFVCKMWGKPLQCLINETKHMGQNPDWSRFLGSTNHMQSVGGKKENLGNVFAYGCTIWMQKLK